MDAADWIFPNKKTGNHESYPQESVKKVAVNAGVPGFKLHASRHYFCSTCVMGGIDTLTIAAWLGHSDGGVAYRENLWASESSNTRRSQAQKLSFGAVVQA